MFEERDGGEVAGKEEDRVETCDGPEGGAMMLAVGEGEGATATGAGFVAVDDAVAELVFCEEPVAEESDFAASREVEGVAAVAVLLGLDDVVELVGACACVDNDEEGVEDEEGSFVRWELLDEA